MMNKKNTYTYGLVGKSLKHSFSQKYFSDFFQKNKLNFSYQLFEIENHLKILDLFKSENLLGINVTIPYKTLALEVVDTISEQAQKIGAINTIVKQKNGQLFGHNTDYDGFLLDLQRIISQRKETFEQAYILGNGGAAKAIMAALESLNIPYQIYTRSPQKNSNQLHFDHLFNRTFTIPENLLVVQCTPVGTFPNGSEKLNLPYEKLFSPHALAYDLVYNPPETAFLAQASAWGAQTSNGLAMLEGQARAAWDLWKKHIV